MTDAERNIRDLSGLVLRATSGLRRDVRALVDALPNGELFVPLSKPVRDAEYGEEVELRDELRLAPHLIVDDEGRQFLPLFTRAELVERAANELGWTTQGAELEYVTLPAKVAFDMALEIVDGNTIAAVVFNPLDRELFLSRNELASLAQGNPIPLVGYVQRIPEAEAERTLTAVGAEPPPAELVGAVELCLEQLPEVTEYRLLTTFNPDRDLEPHLTLALRAPTNADREAIAKRIIGAIGDKVPPPGYIDVIFEGV